MVKNKNIEELFKEDLEKMIAIAIFNENNNYNHTTPKNTLLSFCAFFMKLDLTFNKLEDSALFVDKYKGYLNGTKPTLDIFYKYYDKYCALFTKNKSFRKKLFNELVSFVYGDTDLDYLKIKQIITKEDFFARSISAVDRKLEKIKKETNRNLFQFKDKSELNDYFFLNKSFTQDNLLFNHYKRNIFTNSFSESKPIYRNLDKYLCADNLNSFLLLKQKKGEFEELNHISDEIIMEFNFIYEYAVSNYILPAIYILCYYEPLMFNGATYNISSYHCVGDLLEERNRGSVDTFYVTNEDLAFNLIEELIYYIVTKINNFSFNSEDKTLFNTKFIPEVAEYVVDVLSDIPINCFIQTYRDVSQYDLNKESLPYYYGITNAKENYSHTSEIEYIYNHNLSDFLTFINNIGSLEGLFIDKYDLDKDNIEKSFFIGDDDLFIQEQNIFVEQDNIIEEIEKIFNFGGFIVFSGGGKMSIHRVLRVGETEDINYNKDNDNIYFRTRIFNSLLFQNKESKIIESIINEYL